MPANGALDTDIGSLFGPFSVLSHFTSQLLPSRSEFPRSLVRSPHPRTLLFFLVQGKNPADGARR